MTSPDPAADPVAGVMVPDPAADLVAGVWREAPAGDGPILENPATGEPLRPIAVTPDDRVEAALAQAAAVQTWAGTPAAERAEVLDAVAVAVEAAAERITTWEAYATGVPVRQTAILSVILGGAFRLAAAQLREGWTATTAVREDGRTVHIERLPWGPAVCLVPWNAPAPMAAHKVANALAAGCPAILKPSEYAPYGSQLLATAIDEGLRGCGVPAGVFQFVHGAAATGARLVGDDRVRAVSFTGGLAGGRAVAAACAAGMKPVQLELGGNNPLIVLPDADTGAAARAAADLLTTLNGQWCRALGRLIVPADRHDEIVAAVLDRLGGLAVGDPLDPATDFGPLVHSGHRAAVAAARDRLGGTVLAPVRVPAAGNYLSPALVTGADPAATTEEIFGPVAAVHAYATVDEAVALANGTPYGLEAYVLGTDEDAALAVARRVRAGEVKVNGSSIMSLHLFTPRPAWGLSGLSEEGTAETLRFFTNARVIGVEGGFALHGRSA
ncbi:aldehyde dehydrogenase family protein [Hamadaea tsunoensis]|uniref:aldehyde dehydrogenase family protein n=1 Tax=Hamadaea tsunoensis TaxID=53368 RepID=UPI000410ECF4|nr:aldehyde dehydrogenase family protein [Hamadaea tsunoensis]